MCAVREHTPGPYSRFRLIPEVPRAVELEPIPGNL
jgi:hypothetical protein